MPSMASGPVPPLGSPRPRRSDRKTVGRDDPPPATSGSFEVTAGRLGSAFLQHVDRCPVDSGHHCFPSDAACPFPSPRTVQSTRGEDHTGQQLPASHRQGTRIPAGASQRHVVASTVVRPDASRKAFRSDLPSLWTVAEPVARHVPSVNVVSPVLDCAETVATKREHGPSTNEGDRSRFGNLELASHRHRTTLNPMIHPRCMSTGL